jgi:hypothetical protein
MAKGARANQILKKYAGLQEIMLDKDLAKLGDAYVNFLYSLALSQRLGKPMGAKVDNQTLAGALGNAGLREVLPKRTDRHTRGNAAEALIAYTWLRKVLDFEESLRILRESEDPHEAFTKLLLEISKKLNLTHDTNKHN